MSVLELIMSSVGGFTVSGLLIYAGTRYTARKSSEVGSTLAQIEDRKVNLDEFRTFTERYDSDMSHMRERLAESAEELGEARSTLKIAINYIMSLRHTMRKNAMWPDPIPEKLDRYYTWRSEEEEENRNDE
jgi:hypothetical protein